MDFGQRLKNLRIERGYTQKELGLTIGVSVVAIRSWEKNAKKPAMDALLSLGHAFNVSMDTLMDFHIGNVSNSTLILSQAEKSLLRNYQLLDSHGKKAVDTICALEVERVSSDQQKPEPRKIINIEEVKAVRYMPHYTSPSAAGFSVPDVADYAVDIQGNSMEPYIHDGDMVYVQKDAELSVGDVGIFCVNGAMYCKQYYLDDERNLVLVSANPDLRESNIHVSADSGFSVTVCGKVLLDRRIGLPDYLFED